MSTSVEKEGLILNSFGSPIFISVLFALAVGLILYALLVPKNTGRVSHPAGKGENKYKRLLISASNDIYQSLPRGFGATSRGVEKAERLLQTSGNPWGVTTSQYLYSRYVLAIAGVLLGALLGVVFGGYLVLALPLLGGAVGFFAPFMYHKHVSEIRERAYIRDLPSALDLLIVSVKSGQSFSSAVVECTPLMRNGIVKETFVEINRGLSAGKSLDRVLSEFSQKAPNDGIKTFGRALQEANALNTPMIEVLQSRAEASRKEHFSYLQQLASSLSGKMQLSMLITVFPAVMLIVIAPAIQKISEAF